MEVAGVWPNTHADLLVELHTFILDTLCHAGSQLSKHMSSVRWLMEKHNQSETRHLELFDDGLADPLYLGVEGEHVHGGLSGRVCEGVGFGAELFSMLKGLLGLKYEGDEMGLVGAGCRRQSCHELVF